MKATIGYLKLGERVFSPRPVYAIGFDLGETLLAYEGTPLDWSSRYAEALQFSTLKVGWTDIGYREISEAGIILKKYNSRINPRVREIAAREIFSEICRAWDKPFAPAAEQFVEEFFNFFSRRQYIFDDVVPTLDALEKRGVPVALLTDVPYGMPKSLVLRELLASNLNTRFSGILTSVEVGRRKPDPSGFIMLAAKVGVTPNQMLYVGNEKKDIDGANKAQMGSVLIDRLNHHPDFGQQFCISNLEQLLSLVN